MVERNCRTIKYITTDLHWNNSGGKVSLPDQTLGKRGYLTNYHKHNTATAINKLTQTQKGKKAEDVNRPSRGMSAESAAGY